jgi:hypothetical protein
VYFFGQFIQDTGDIRLLVYSFVFRIDLIQQTQDLVEMRGGRFDRCRVLRCRR